MYKLCKTEQSSARQRELEQGLLRQMYHRRYEDISISDLCDHLNIPRKTFYRYFSGKDGALFSLLDHTIMEFYETGTIEGLKGSTPLGDLERFFAFWYEKRTLLDVLYRSSLTGTLVERCTLLARNEQLAPSVTKGWDNLKQDIAISFVVCGLLSMVFRWQQEGFCATAKEMADVATAMLSRPLLTKN